MKRVAIVVVVLGALLWAKKRFVDPPKVEEPSKAEVIAEKIGRIAKAKREGKPINPGDLKLDGTSTPLAPPDTSTVTPDTLQAAVNAALSSLSPEQRAKQRVQQLMTAWQQGPKPVAAVMWQVGPTAMNEANFDIPSFDAFCQEKELKELQSFEVGSAYHRNDGSASYTVVDVMINGAMYHMGVPEKAQPIFWTF
jgi:hypothetical protein